MSFLPARYLALLIAGFVFLLSLWMGLMGEDGWWLAVPSGALVLVGVIDLLQTRQALRRNYPILAHFRYFFESIRPEIRQYFLEDDTDAKPFSRNQRSIVYQRAKVETDKRPFGTQLDLYQAGYEWMNHSIRPATLAGHDFRIEIGNHPDCPRAQPYLASVFNISAMSFGALSANAILALNAGAKSGGFMHDTGEGSISQYHRINGGDLVWEIGSGYFGCRNDDGSFSEERFIANAGSKQVKMIEVKLSQGAKPGQGGILPGAKVTIEIAAARGVPQGRDCLSPASHTAFSTPIGLLNFVERLRTLSGGKPTGFKLAIGHPWEFFAIAKAMLETGITPDFIVVDGGEGGTGAAKAAPARRRWSSPTTSARPCRKRCCWCITRWSAPACATASRSAHPARSSPRSTSRAPSRSAPTGATRRAASCSRSAACSRRAAIPTAARLASPPRTRSARRRSTCPTRRRAWRTSTRIR